jgi:hypothetical protein
LELRGLVHEVDLGLIVVERDEEVLVGPSGEGWVVRPVEGN